MFKIFRSIVYYIKGYSETKILALEATTSDDAWGPYPDQLAALAAYTHSHKEETAPEILDVLADRMRGTQQNWRQVLKALRVLEYCIIEGDQCVFDWAKKHAGLIGDVRRTFHEGVLAEPVYGATRGAIEGIRSRAEKVGNLPPRYEQFRTENPLR